MLVWEEWKRQIDYLGHIISSEGVATNPAKIRAICSWPVPKSTKELKNLLRLIGYYRKFVHHYGLISKSLTNLLKKEAFQRGEEAQIAFETFREATSKTLALAFSDFSQSFIVETDASNMGLGAEQNGHPIAYVSKAFGPRN